MPNFKILGKWKTKKFKIGDSIRSIAYDHNSNHSYLGCEDGRIRKFNLKTEKMETILHAHISCIRNIDIFGDWLISSSNDKSIKIFSKINGTLITTFFGHTNSIPIFVIFSIIPEETIITFILCLKALYSKKVNGSNKFFLPKIPKVIIKKILESAKIAYILSGSYDNTIRVIKFLFILCVDRILRSFYFSLFDYLCQSLFFFFYLKFKNLKI